MAKPKKAKIVGKPLSRKQRRKMERLDKKQKMATQFVRRKEPKNDPEDEPERPTTRSRSPSKAPTISKPTHEDRLKLHRKRALEAATRQDDIEISKLEKLLKIKKRKKIPTSFKDEGLDYILDLTERCAQSSAREESTRPSQKPDKLRSVGSPEETDGSGDLCEESCDQSDGSGDLCDESCDQSDGYIDTGDKLSASDAGEESCDDHVTPCTEGKYVPPHLRSEDKRIDALQRKVQGLINRLSEANVRSISAQLEAMYQDNSRNDMSTAFSRVLLRLCSAAGRLSERFALEHGLLVAILHSNVGQDVGAFLIQKLALQLEALLRDSPHSHSPLQLSCVLMIIASLYNYRVIHCGLVYDIIRVLLKDLTERNIELLLILLKNTGMEIRRDDASSLKDIILLIQQKASSLVSQSPRAKFMLETIAALKTNNSHKIPNYDPSLTEHMKRLLRGCVRSSGEGQLKVSLSDLLNADSQGRWWVVGSAWSGREPQPQGPPQDSWLVELARKQRMTTDVRKTVFSVIMTSEDYSDAFEKLLRLGLKEVQEREMVHVLLDCCLQERVYNPYYAHLGHKLCEFSRSHQVTFQYSVWDRFKGLESMSKTSRANLMQLLSHLISNKSLSLAVLRVVEFTDLGPVSIKFYKRLLIALLTDHPTDTVRAVFSRTTHLAHLKSFRDNLVIFMRHYLVKQNDSSLLTKQLEMAEQCMRTEGHLF